MAAAQASILPSMQHSTAQSIRLMSIWPEPALGWLAAPLNSTTAQSFNAHGSHLCYACALAVNCTFVQETSPWCALEVGGKGHGDDDDPNAFEPHINDWAFCDSPTTCH